MAIACLNSHAQKPTLEISFTAIDDTVYQSFDSIIINNLTQECDTILYYPDTVLILDYISSVNESKRSKDGNFILSQNSPNPFDEKTSFNLVLLDGDKITIRVSDLLGRQIGYFKGNFQPGRHDFTFYPGSEKYYLLSVTVNRATKSIKMFHTGSGPSSSCRIIYEGAESISNPLKFFKSTNTFVFNPGDELLYVGYSNSVESATVDSPTSSQLITFQFATNIRCPGTQFINYEGQIYNTIQVRSQCWLHENLNFETRNSWCFNNNPDHCDTYGRMYLWDAAITACPEGWHLPTDNEWKILEGVADSQHGILDPVWNQSGGWRGYDVSTNLKSKSGWNPSSGNGLDLYGFTSYPGGYRFTSGWFIGRTSEQGYWCSTESDEALAWHRFTAFNFDGIFRFPFDKNFGFYVRCVKD